MQKNKKIHFIWISLVIFILFFTGCNESSNTSNEIKTILVDGMFEIVNINNQQQPIKLEVTGMDCLITVANDVDLVEVILDGNNNIVRVSSFDTFNLTVKDPSSEIQYYE